MAPAPAVRMAHGYIDPDLFDVFGREGVYAGYARKFLDPAQLADLDVTRLT